MNLTSTEADAWFRTLLPLVAGLGDRDLFVLPPFTSIWVARERLLGTSVAWGAQDIHAEDAGAHTGDVSGPMLADLGCQFVEVGHSERRREHAETTELIAAKAAAAMRRGIRPILCVGEQRRASVETVRALLVDDLARCLARIGRSDAPRVVIAYEPVWAIGEGARAAPPDQVGGVHRDLHAWLDEWSDGAEIPVIYGGSVDSAGAGQLLAQPGVDGLFVGRHALDPVEFAKVAWAGAPLDRSTTPTWP